MRVGLYQMYRLRMPIPSYVRDKIEKFSIQSGVLVRHSHDFHRPMG